jgi:hypothetical protein
MNKISLYTLLVLLFLGISKSFSPTAQKTTFVQNEQVFPGLFNGAPLSLVLVDAFTAGFLIKTYYLKLKIVHGFKQPEFMIVRTNKSFYKANQANIGMSLFRRYERNNKESTTPLPPGSLYVGDPAFGGWKYHNSGQRKWHFHRVYRHFSRQFFWGDYQPNYEFYEKVMIHMKNETPFYGLNGEFGTEGSITKSLYENSPYRIKKNAESFIEHLKMYISLPASPTPPKKEEVKG